MICFTMQICTNKYQGIVFGETKYSLLKLEIVAKGKVGD